MGFKNYEPARHEFVLNGGSFTFSVRGLSLQDVSRLVNHHLPDLEALFNLFARGAGNLDDNKFESLIMSLVSEAPGFAANLIALAADDPEGAEKAATLPFPTQVDAIMKIGDLTFVDVGGWGKGMERIAALLNRTNVKAMLPKGPVKAT